MQICSPARRYLMQWADMFAVVALNLHLNWADVNGEQWADRGGVEGTTVCILMDVSQLHQSWCKVCLQNNRASVTHIHHRFGLFATADERQICKKEKKTHTKQEQGPANDFTKICYYALRTCYYLKNLNLANSLLTHLAALPVEMNHWRKMPVSTDVNITCYFRIDSTSTFSYYF